ncbi:MAG TPA: ATP-binding sensor histidine kinase [Polyangia bacterium]|nr:ATP-binding sensor histidine kinase [Polyangia bacterium]
MSQRPRKGQEAASASSGAAYTVQAVLQETASTGVYRVTRVADDRSVILKTLRRKPPRAHELERLRREYEVGVGLNVRSVVRPLALESVDGVPMLVLEDFGGESLDRLSTGPMEPRRFLRLAVAVTGAIADLHKHGIVHRDIKPGNIIVREDTTLAKIIDLGIATAPGQGTAGAPAASALANQAPLIEGSLPYMSPEQTGRMNRTVDERSDLYSLGVTFYELLAGQLPLKGEDALEWIHAHLAREPTPLAWVAPAVPDVLAAIVMKLLAKRPEERYQTATGLLHDLSTCAAQLDRNGRIIPFDLGGHDAADTFEIPRKLYGRAEPAARLEAAFERVAKTGRAELVLVSGYSGIGKSSLVLTLETPISVRGALFLAGKFDLVRRDVPYATLVRAFRDEVVARLDADEASVAAFGAHLDAALGPNADLIVQMFPELERVLGSRPPVPGLARSEEETRFHRVFRQFLSVLTDGERTLVLFLDDLQWADAASLRLLTRVLAHPDTPRVLTIGAYRDNEVHASHPLELALEDLRRAGTEESRVVLAPLSVDDTTALVADAVHADLATARPLAELVHEKTAGNPFFVIQFLTALHDEGLISAVPLVGLVWDVAKIRERGFTDNVVDLMTRKIERLDRPVVELLELAACIGNTIDVGTLAIVRGGTRADTEALLQVALAEGVLLRRRGVFRFLHDRVQQAAYALIPEAQRAEVHLRIGRLLLASRQPGGADEDAREETRDGVEDDSSLFDVTDHLNVGAHLLTDAAERRVLARLNLLAGRKAKASTAYASAIRYFEAGLPLLDANAWSSSHAVAYGLHFEHAESLYLVGRFAEAEARFAVVLANTDSVLERADVYQIEVDLFTSQIALDKAVDTAVRGLEELGVELSAHPTESQLTATADRVFAALAGRTMDELLALPRMIDPRMRAALDILAVLFGPSHSTDPNLPFIVYANMVEISLRHGNTDASAIGYAYFGMAIGAKFGRYKEGYAFGKLGADLAEKHGLLAYKSKLALIFGDCIGPWSRPLLGALDHLDVAFRTAVETGDLTFACYCCNHIVFDRLLLGEPLADVFRESLRRYDFARKASFDASCKIILDIQAFMLALRGLSPDALREQARGDLRARPQPGLQADDQADDVGFDERAFHAEMDVYPWPIIRCWHFIMRLSARYYLGDHEGALADGWRARELIWTSMAHLQEPEFWFFFALTLAATHGKVAAAERPRQLDLIRVHERKLARWAAECPENFEAKWALVAAELARIEGRAEPAMSLYEQAIRAARASGFVQNEALGLELASGFHRARGFELIADTYMRESRAAYVRWGAFGKVAELDRRYPHLVASASRAADEARPEATATLAMRAEWIDLVSVVRASQSISSETSLDKLVGTLFRIVLEQGGAQRGFLVMRRNGEAVLEAEAWLDEGGVRARILPSVPVATSRLVPRSLVAAVLGSGRRVLLDDASRPGAFSNDEYVVRVGPRSVLALPIMRHGEVAGLLYLENNALTGAFTSDRLASLELVTAQAAISLEIARLVETERTARAAAEGAERRAAFLADATALLVASLDADTQLTRLARLAVQSLADVCLIDLVDGTEVRRVAAAHKDPAAEAPLAELAARFPARLDATSPQGTVARTKESLLLEDPDVGAGFSSLLVLPLVTGGDVVGVISLAQAEPAHRYGPRDLEVARELAARAAIAVSNARLYRATQAAVQLRDDFLGMASHELRTPLTSLILSLQTLERRPWEGRPLAPLIDARRISLAARQAERLDRLIGDLLDVSRMEAGQLVLVRALVDLGELAREVVARFEEDAARSGCAITIETTPAIVGSWDASRLDQVVTNLLGNALKFGAGRPIHVRVDTRGDRALLVVRDEGVGIEPEHQRTVFDRFDRGGVTESQGGLGLGLYICRRLVDAHGGRISVSSRPGSGSTFSVELPFS